MQIRFPGESAEYRTARDRLLEREIELMGHAGGRRAEHGSAIGRLYRETTPEMLTRILTGIERRLDMVVEVARKTRGDAAHAPAQRDQHAHAP